MDWDALGAMGEMAGALAVIISLIYVGYQVRLNTAERRVESVRSLTDNLRQLALVYVNNEQAGIAWHKVLAGEILSERELDLMSDQIYAHLMTIEEAFNKYQAGYIDAEFLNARVALTRIKLLRSPQLLQVYERMKAQGIYTASFINWLDGKLAEPQPTLFTVTPATQVDR